MSRIAISEIFGVGRDEDFGFCIDNEACEVLARTESLSHLEQLDFLGGCTFDHVGMGYVVNSPNLERVEVLKVRSSEFHKANVLTHSPMMSRLTSFTSCDCHFKEFDLGRDLPLLKHWHLKVWMMMVSH